MKYEQFGQEDIGSALWQAITHQEHAEQCPPLHPLARSVPPVRWGIEWLLAKMTRLAGRRLSLTINRKGTG